MEKNLITPERKNFWNNRHVFITGGFGLLGTTLTEMLHQMGARLTLLKRDHVPSSRLFETPAIDHINIVNGDFEDYDTVYRALNEYEIETVIHVGAQPIAPVGNRAPLPTLKTNIMGTCNVLEAARMSPTVKRVLVASSDKAYGPQPVLPYTEEAPLRGTHPYDVSKSCTDLIAQMYHNTFKLPVCVTRCGNLYGPGDLNWQRVVPETIKHVLHNENPVIRSDGKFIRDYFFIRDAANAYLVLAENMDRPEIVGQAFNFSTGNSKTVIDIVQKIMDVMGRKDLKMEILNQAKAEIHDQTLSSEKAARLLNWKPVYTIEEGLAETIAWYKNYFEKKRGNALESSYDALLS
jgi:CDP-glucose 4,6-dehydratase